MKFTGHVDIAQPRATVVAYFIDPTYLGEYQDGFVKKEIISGTPATEGAKATMVYKYGKRDMILKETVLSNQLPESFLGHYHHKHMDNTMLSEFIELSPTSTRYQFTIHYTRINWIMPKLMAILFPSVYRKQGQKWMNQFKSFLEMQ